MKIEDEITTLIRDIARVGYIAKSDARNRINAIIAKVLEKRQAEFIKELEDMYYVFPTNKYIEEARADAYEDMNYRIARLINKYVK